MAGGEFAQFEKVDDYTVKYSFVETYPTFIDLNATNLGGHSMGLHLGWTWNNAPKHWMKQFHPDYTDQSKVDALVAASGHPSWPALIGYGSFWPFVSDTPMIAPWTTLAGTSSQDLLWRMERNPYFFAVDTEGNQLPYIGDRVAQGVGDIELRNLKFMAGEADRARRSLDKGKLTLFMVNKDKRGYEVVFPPSLKTSAVLWINQTFDNDPEIRKWLRSFEFRKALALAVDKELFDAVLFSTLGTIRSAIPSPLSPYYPGEEYEDKFIKYDPKEAERILDSLGLTERDADGFRLRSDGKGTLVFLLFGAGDRTPSLSGMAELTAQDLGDIGIKTNLKTTPGSTWLFKNESQLTVAGFFGADPWRWGWIPHQKAHSQAALIGDWIVSKGAEGVDSNADPAYAELARSIDLWEQGKPKSMAECVDLTKEIAKIYVDNYYLAGIVGNVPGLMLVNKKLRNVFTGPDLGGRERPELYFFKD